MCGRLALQHGGAEISDRFNARQLVLQLEPRFNVAPAQQIAVVAVNRDGERELGLMKWGLVPRWAKDPAIGNRLINARAETVAEKPAFRQAFQRRRCLIPADGFYEWRKLDGEGRKKQPYFIRRKDGGLFALAGLWERWQPEGEGEPLRTCVVITTTPNELMAPLHDRMPVILSREAEDIWLDGRAPLELLPSLLVPCPDQELEAYPVSTRVNRPGYDDPDCIEPLPEEAPGAAG